MNWIDDTQNAINFIENNLTENIRAGDVSRHIHSSTDYFQRTFNIVTGLSISEYIRNRRLTLAGEELRNTQAKVIDVALKYGYDSPESFTKAFTRFHGVTPTSAKASGEGLKHFYPLSINIYIKGGFGMKRKIIPNIPEIRYYGNEVDYAVNIFNAAFNTLEEQISRSEISAFSGMANYFCWIEGNWIGSRGCEIFGVTNETPFEAELNLMKTFGLAAKYIAVSRDSDGNMLNTDDEQIKRDIVGTIDKGYPIVAKFDHIHKNCVIIGYENDGDKLICKEGVEGEDESGGSGFSSGHADAEIITRENWLKSIENYIMIKEKLEPVPERQRILELFKKITAFARRTDKIRNRMSLGFGGQTRGDMSVGFAAWEVYLHMLEHEDLSHLPLLSDEPDDDSISLRIGVYCDGLCQIWERHAGLEYYRSLAEKYPEWREELETAVAALDECSKYGGFLWSQGFAFEGEGLEKFRDPAARKLLADEGRKAMQKDMEAIEQFEKILKKEGLSAK